MKRKAEADYRRQLEEERQRAIEESHWVLEGKQDEDRQGMRRVANSKSSLNTQVLVSTTGGPSVLQTRSRRLMA